MAECGLAALAMVAGAHGLDTDLATLRQRFEVSSRGVTLAALMQTADAIGLAPRPVKLPLDGLDELALPAILHWDMNHFVVVERVEKARALIHDPAGVSRWMTLAQISPHFTGVALELRPTPTFTPGRHRSRIALRQLWTGITGLRRALLQVLLLSLVLQAFALASPLLLKVAIDRVLPFWDVSLLATLALGFAGFALINACAMALRGLVLLHAGSAMAQGIAINIARRMMRLPLAWFERRQVGDVLSRFQSVAPIQRALTEGAVAAFIDGALALVTLVAMALTSAALSAISIVALLLYLAVRLWTFPRERRAQEAAIAAQGAEQGMMVETLRGFLSIRASNRETARHAAWSSRLTAATNARIRHQRIGVGQQAANALLFGIELIAVTVIAIGFVIDGVLSLGMVLAYLAWKAQFTLGATRLVDRLIEFRMLGLHLDRLSDIALVDQDPGFAPTLAPKPLAGRITLESVSFRYAPDLPLVLDNVSLDIGPGEHVAITGPSGSGKSTLARIILGLIEPSSGRVLIDGVPLPEFGRRALREQAAAVLQDDALFAGSIADNIALFDAAPDPRRIAESARAAAIDRDVAATPMGFETMVGDMGIALSGGQRQRILLARALYRQPRLLVMDEATSHLDLETENLVNSAISKLGVTRVVIAHRPQSIAAADRLVELRSGLIASALDQ